MTWLNNRRAKRKADNRRAYHEALMEGARTPSEKFWRACGWLISEAKRTGRVDDAIEAIQSKVNEIREEEVDYDRSDYAA